MKKKWQFKKTLIIGTAILLPTLSVISCGSKTDQGFVTPEKANIDKSAAQIEFDKILEGNGNKYKAIPYEKTDLYMAINNSKKHGLIKNLMIPNFFKKENGSAILSDDMKFLEKDGIKPVFEETFIREEKLDDFDNYIASLIEKIKLKINDNENYVMDLSGITKIIDKQKNTNVLEYTLKIFKNNKPLHSETLELVSKIKTESDFDVTNYLQKFGGTYFYNSPSLLDAVENLPKGENLFDQTATIIYDNLYDDHIRENSLYGWSSYGIKNKTNQQQIKQDLINKFKTNPYDLKIFERYVVDQKTKNPYLQLKVYEINKQNHNDIQGAHTFYIDAKKVVENLADPNEQWTLEKLINFKVKKMKFKDLYDTINQIIELQVGLNQLNMNVVKMEIYGLVEGGIWLKKMQNYENDQNFNENFAKYLAKKYNTKQLNSIVHGMNYFLWERLKPENIEKLGIKILSGMYWMFRIIEDFSEFAKTQ